MNAEMAQKEQMEVAQTTLRLPDGRVFQYKPKTVAKRYQLYEKCGIETLIPRTWCDKGGIRVITQEAESEMYYCDESDARQNLKEGCPDDMEYSEMYKGASGSLFIFNSAKFIPILQLNKYG